MLYFVYFFEILSGSMIENDLIKKKCNSFKPPLPPKKVNVTILPLLQFWIFKFYPLLKRKWYIRIIDLNVKIWKNSKISQCGRKLFRVVWKLVNTFVRCFKLGIHNFWWSFINLLKKYKTFCLISLHIYHCTSLTFPSTIA